MKRVIKIADLIFLRLLPLVIISFYCVDAITFFFKKTDYYHLFLTLEDFSYSMCFALVGLSAVLRYFKKTEKASVYCRYGAGVMALIYIVLSILEKIPSLGLSRCYETTPSFNYIIPPEKLQFVLLLIVFSTVIINCLLKDKFYKIKVTLIIVCEAAFLIAVLYSPIYTLIEIRDVALLKGLLNLVLFSFPFCAVILTGLMPSKDNTVSDL